ncbi:hypothetical protein RHGRI_028609 [Rhododendron griersonianum]|nr:hypothetical protein RHGRI_028609 [Rhododendron griersonianum]
MMTSEIIRSIKVKNSCGDSSQISLAERSTFAIFTGAPNRGFLMFKMTAGSKASVASILTLVIIVTSRRDLKVSISPVIGKCGINLMTGYDLYSLLSPLHEQYNKRL